ncbi:MAG: hypothetical protein INQ03_06300 [Candidatus Heimdallarchaeota archaeon]|nr:hypothetical protein [Candidatus Heimdallarchaeota archaeon]
MRFCHILDKSQSITDKFQRFRLLFSVLKTQFKWNELADEAYFDEAIWLAYDLGQNAQLIELYMMRGVTYLLHAEEPFDENYGIADEYFMKCWPLQSWENRDEFIVEWPWKTHEESSTVPLEE